MSDDIIIELPDILLVPRPGRLKSITITYTQAYDRGDIEYALEIGDGGATYDCTFRARLLQGGNPYTKIKDELTPIQHRRLARDIGSLAFHDAPQHLHIISVAVEKAFATGPYERCHHALNPSDPAALATLKMPAVARPFPKALEDLLGHHLKLPGRRKVVGTYRKET